MIARYAPPISYNFINLIRLHDDEETIFEKVILSYHLVVPFFFFLKCMSSLAEREICFFF